MVHGPASPARSTIAGHAAYRRARALCVGLFALAMSTTTFAPPAEAATSETARFATFETAWQRANTPALVACMEAKGKITVLLLEKPFSGKADGYAKERASKSFVRYFSGLHEPRLKDVTPPKQRKSNASVRIYDYTYRPKKSNSVTTRLEVRLKRVANHWVLDSLSERRKS